MSVSETKLIVRYAETDQMGIVHHSNYPVWYEAARTEFIKTIGMSYSEIEDNGILLPLIELKCCYKGAAKYEDEIVVKTRIKEMTPVRIKFYYEVFKNSGQELINSGYTEHAWTTKQLKPVNIKKSAPKIYELVMSAVD